MIKEAEMRKIPNFFSNIKTKKDWENSKNEILDLFLKEEYGFLPEKIEPKITKEDVWVDFAGKGKWEKVFFTFEKEGKSHTVETELVLPKGKTSVPVFISLNFQKEVPNKYLPMEEILDSGFGVLAFCYENVTSDNRDFTNGLCNLFQKEGKCEFGKISMWAYFALICMDYILTREEVDKNNIAIIGHSRLGKTALLASAIDTRFKLTCSNDSGCCGASISRGKKEGNETISDILRVFPHWFVDSFALYADKEESLPFDQHMLLSLIAPRYLAVAGAKEDIWADNKGQLLSCNLAKEIWALYGEEEKISYYEREGTHFLSRADWRVFMDKFKEIIENEI